MRSRRQFLADALFAAGGVSAAALLADRATPDPETAARAAARCSTPGPLLDVDFYGNLAQGRYEIGTPP